MCALLVVVGGQRRPGRPQRSLDDDSRRRFATTKHPAASWEWEGNSHDDEDHDDSGKWPGDTSHPRDPTTPRMIFDCETVSACLLKKKRRTLPFALSPRWLYVLIYGEYVATGCVCSNFNSSNNKPPSSSSPHVPVAIRVVSSRSNWTWLPEGNVFSTANRYGSLVWNQKSSKVRSRSVHPFPPPTHFGQQHGRRAYAQFVIQPQCEESRIRTRLHFHTTLQLIATPAMLQYVDTTGSGRPGRRCLSTSGN